MPVALDDLRGDRRDLQSEPLADGFFVFRLEMRGVADRARDLADSHLLGGHLEALEVALHLGVPVRQLEAERDRLGVNAVRAADLRRVLELEARRFSTSAASSRSSRMIADACFTSSACAVSTTSFDVSP